MKRRDQRREIKRRGKKEKGKRKRFFVSPFPSPSSLNLCVSASLWLIRVSASLFQRNAIRRPRIQNITMFLRSGPQQLFRRRIEVKAREALAALIPPFGCVTRSKRFTAPRYCSAKVERFDAGNSAVIAFCYQAKNEAVSVDTNRRTVGAKVTEAELLLRVDLLNPGAPLPKQTLRKAD